MKSLIFIFSLVLALFAEPSFQDVQSMIANQQFKQAKLALTAITANHPNSSKVYYTLAQANAGLGDLPAARDALDRAKALNPKLDFATSSQLADLEQAITPQAHLVTPIESSSIVIWWIIFTSATIATIWFVVFKPFNKPKPTSKPEQPSTKYSTGYTSTSKYTPPSRGTYSTYVDLTPSKPTEVHHHHHSDSGISTAGTILTAGLTAAAVSTLMSDDKSSCSSHSESSSWEDSTPSSSSTWDDDSSSSRSSSWSDSSSSSSSWSDSSSSSSSSSSSWD